MDGKRAGKDGSQTALPGFATSSTAGRRPGAVLKRSFQNIIDRSMDYLLCKICLQVYWEPFSTLCGHTFCRSCINQHLMHNTRCPICDTNLDPKKAKIIPNYTAATLVEKILLSNASEFNKPKLDKRESKDGGETILSILYNTDNIDLISLRKILEAVECRKLELELNDEYLRNLLLYEFLEKMIEKREKYAEQLQTQLEKLRIDKQKVVDFLNKQTIRDKTAVSTHCQIQQYQRVVPDLTATASTSSALQPVVAGETEVSNDSGNKLPILSVPGLAVLPEEKCSISLVSTSPDVFVPPHPTSQRVFNELSKYRKRLSKHLNSLESAYFNSRQALPNSQSNTLFVGSSAMLELDEFSQVIRGMSQYDDMKRLATLNYNVEASSPLSIVSSIEFDKDGEYFVVAGVTRMIKIYDFNLVVEFNGENPYPIEQLQCNSKISNVSWNPYNKNLLASSDYEGAVQLWDTNVGRATRTLREHERRCWTVQFNNVDPHLMASGSDDSKVKLWSVTVPHSICTIDAKANVCAVHFSPQSKNHLVFGSADHCVHLYDIRNPSKALTLFCGHRKAVSYVKYCNETEVVSASTDGDLRIWDVNSYKCLRTLRGHQNERNFVGLATDGYHVVCGSENNHLYLYYKCISDPLMSFDFGSKSVEDLNEPQSFMLADNSAMSSSTSGSAVEASSASSLSHQQSQSSSSFNDFVSAICWKKNSDIVVAANSQGVTHILQLH